MNELLNNIESLIEDGFSIEEVVMNVTGATFEIVTPIYESINCPLKDC